jgi:hypothetical protein
MQLCAVFDLAFVDLGFLVGSFLCSSLLLILFLLPSFVVALALVDLDSRPGARLADSPTAAAG